MLTGTERLSDDVLDAPVEISVDGVDCDPTLRSLLSRLVGQLAMWDAAVNDRPYEVFTYGGMIADVLTFAAHRRTLVCGALADAGVTDLGAGDPMRWVAEHA